MASPAATKWMKASMLVTTLTTEALPMGPMYMISPPMVPSKDSTRWKVSFSPPTSTVISPELAK